MTGNQSFSTNGLSRGGSPSSSSAAEFSQPPWQSALIAMTGCPYDAASSSATVAARGHSALRYPEAEMIAFGSLRVDTRAATRAQTASGPAVSARSRRPRSAPACSACTC